MDNPQDKDAWLFARIGNLTASRMGLVVRRKKDGGTYAGYDDYVTEIVTERLTGKAAEHFVSKPMERGMELEQEAADAYAFETGRTVAFSDYVEHPTIKRAGASPDRLVDSDWLLEIKVPNTTTHINTLLSGEINEDYIWQMVWQCECAGKKGCDFMSYDNRLPANLQSKIITFVPSIEQLELARERAAEFLAKVDALEAELRALSPKTEIAA